MLPKLSGFKHNKGEIEIKGKEDLPQRSMLLIQLQRRDLARTHQE
jgi:hypothetical protein